MGTSSSGLWHDRLESLRLNLNRIIALFDNKTIQLDQKLIGKFTSPLSGLLIRIEKLEKLSTTAATVQDLWKQLADLQRSVQAEIDSQLEILGGIAIAQGFPQVNHGESLDNDTTREAEAWINEFIQPLDLDYIFVLIGRGPLVDPEKRIVRLPFLDWDHWHLPLLARAIGRLACEERTYERKLGRIIEPIIEQVENLLDSNPAKPPVDLERLLLEVQVLWQKYRQILTTEGQAIFRDKKKNDLQDLAEHERRFLYFLFADQFATAVLGPVYAISAFMLELDYAFPDRYDLEDPDLIEGREMTPRFLPASVHRAAAILATLEAMNHDDIYTKIIKRLNGLWTTMLISTKQMDNLPNIRQQLKPWLDMMYEQVILETVGTRIRDPINHNNTEKYWETAQVWWKAFMKPVSRPTSKKPPIHILTTAMWLHRLDYPKLADDLLNAVNRWQPDQWSSLTLNETEADPAKAVFQARMSRIKNRWQRIENILSSEQIPAPDRAAVLGRFYRLISEQWYSFEQIEPFGHQEDQLPSGVWSKLNDLYRDARPLQREAMEFLGGLMVHLADLDREPVKITLTKEGPSICDLADNILRDCVRCTGVNWSARTVLGRDPFLEPSTDVIRVRFPDWSVWNLPLMAHEFGHITALATPAFHEFKKREADTLKQGAPTRLEHLDEFFADVFATYTFGPAFACDAILLQFNPSEAFLARDSHPTHDERAQVILATLNRINASTRINPRWDTDAVYGAMIRQLEQSWKDGIAACDGKAENEAAYTAKLEESTQWARELYRMVDKYFRFGAGYKPDRWKFAQKLADNLLRSGSAPDVPSIYYMAKQSDLKTLTLIDILNALWVARTRVGDNLTEVEDLTRLADSICRALVSE